MLVPAGSRRGGRFGISGHRAVDGCWSRPSAGPSEQTRPPLRCVRLSGKGPVRPGAVPAGRASSVGVTGGRRERGNCRLVALWVVDGVDRSTANPESVGGAVGFLGPAGTFSEQAAREYLKAASGRGTEGADAASSEGSGGVLVPHRDIPDLLRAAHRGDVAVGVVPAENSIEGTVVVTLDMLVHEVELSIVGEIVIPVRQHLLVRGGAGEAIVETAGRGAHGERGFEGSLRSVRTVVSHPQALAQCRRYLQTHLPDAALRPALSTAAAAKQVAEGPAGEMAAIGTELSAALYGLTVVAGDIQDVSDNATRFFVVKKGDTAGAARPTGSDKTSIVFGFAADQPGNLYGALGELANRGINLSKLESRPAKRALGHYLFFVDLDGHARDASVAEALDALRRRCAYMKVLGSYPKAVYATLTRPRAFPPSELPDIPIL